MMLKTECLLSAIVQKRSTFPQSWIDDYESWSSSCCTYNDKSGNISTDPRVITYTVCQSNYDDCKTGLIGNEEARCSTNPPFFGGGKSSSKSSEVYTPAEFQENIAWFLDDSPGESCATAGKAAYRCETD